MDLVLVRDVLAPAGFITFVAGAWWATRRGAAAAARRRAANVCLAFVLAVSFGVGLRKFDLFPFVSWPLLAGVFPEDITYHRFVVVGADGREYDVDDRAWTPFGADELMTWTFVGLPRLDSARQREAGAFLLGLAAAAAARVRAGDPPNGAEGRLGRLAAPRFLLHPARWRTPDDLPPAPFQALRLYRDEWNIEARARDPSAVGRDLRYEYRAP